MSKRDTDREADGPGLTPAPLSGSRAERYQVFLHVDVETLRKDGEGVRSNLEDGMRVSAEPQDGRAKHGPTSRRLSCDCSTVKVIENGDGRVLDIGRRTRSIPPAIRRALQVRDQGCRWPGCGLRFTHGHHIEHWIDGGETSLRNLISLCHFHHRKVHEDGWAVCYNQKDDTALFFGPRGMVRAHRPARLDGGRNGGGGGPEGADRRERAGGPSPNPVLDLISENRRHGADPDGLGCAARHLKPRRLPWGEWA